MQHHSFPLKMLEANVVVTTTEFLKLSNVSALLLAGTMKVWN